MSTRAGLLGMLNMVEVRALASIATYQKFHAHEYLCRQGDLADGIFIILTGVAAIIVNGKQVIFLIQQRAFARKHRCTRDHFSPRSLHEFDCPAHKPFF